jgi:hypothetical protein
MLRQLDISKIRASKRLKAFFTKAQELNDRATKFKSNARNLSIEIKNIKGDYLYQRFTQDASCSKACAFAPVEERELSLSDNHQEILTLEPYSVQMIIFTQKPSEVEATPATKQPETQSTENTPAT